MYTKFIFGWESGFKSMSNTTRETVSDQFLTEENSCEDWCWCMGHLLIWGRYQRARGRTLWDRTQQKNIPNDLKCNLKNEREVEEYLKCNSNENGNNLRLYFYLGSLLCKRDYSVTFVLSCLKNKVHFKKQIWLLMWLMDLIVMVHCRMNES